MKTGMWVLLTIGLALTAGCRDNEESFSRYPSISVPEYESKDYIRDLSDPNPERVYNATCQLGVRASHFAKTLCATNADPASAEYQLADEAYRTVCRQLEAEEPHTVAASLRFLQLFARNYKPKEELVEPVVRVESSHPLVQFEQVALLRILATEETQLPEPQLRRFMDSPSWIVSRSSYNLISRLDQESLRQVLVQRYQDTGDECERLILIRAMRQGLEADEARLLQNEMLTSQSARIRTAIATTLVQNLSSPAIHQWLGDHYPHFSVKERNGMFSSCKDIDLKCRFLSQGYVPQDQFLTGLLKDLLDEEKTEDRDDHLRIEQAILANPELAGRWQSMKDTAEQERRRMQALSKELVPITLEFMERIQPLHAKYEIPESEAEEVWGMILKTVEEKMENAERETESTDPRS